ncbi:MAG: aminoacyl-tRNA hydrolase [Planctomycetota bacterium]
MKLIVGLGNPGQEYAQTRHNAGFMAVDRLAAEHAAGQRPKSKFHAVVLDATIAGEKCLLMKPTTYMNRSGQAIAEAVRFYKLQPASDLLVLVDETALETGTIRVRAEGSAGGHNGLADIQQKLGTPAYPRLRIGIGPRPPVIRLHDFVLGRFLPEEAEPLKSAIETAAEATRTFVAEGVDTAMNRFNTKPPKPPKPTKPDREPQATARPDERREPEPPDRTGPKTIEAPPNEPAAGETNASESKGRPQ